MKKKVSLTNSEKRFEEVMERRFGYLKKHKYKFKQPETIISNSNSFTCSRCKVIIVFPFEFTPGDKSLALQSQRWKCSGIIDNKAEYLCTRCISAENYMKKMDEIFPKTNRKAAG